MTPLRHIAHRPDPLPTGPWVMFQRWHDLLFAHWPLAADIVQKLLPAGMEVDTFDDAAWIGLVPFRMTSVRLRLTPPFAPMSDFPEMNVRTYVRCNGKQGVYFFSLDAANLLAVHIARAWFCLPYYSAAMSIAETNDVITYRTRRTHRNCAAAEFAGKYGPTGLPFLSEKHTLEQWLTERYYLFTSSRGKGLIVGAIHHKPWPLQHAFWEPEIETAIQAAGIARPNSEPHLLFARQLDVLIWRPKAI
jgi:uncharacterized protein